VALASGDGTRKNSPAAAAEIEPINRLCPEIPTRRSLPIPRVYEFPDEASAGFHYVKAGIHVANALAVRTQGIILRGLCFFLFNPRGSASRQLWGAQSARLKGTLAAAIGLNRRRSPGEIRAEHRCRHRPGRAEPKTRIGV
jgi:hypothetical protein